MEASYPVEIEDSDSFQHSILMLNARGVGLLQTNRLVEASVVFHNAIEKLQTRALHSDMATSEPSTAQVTDDLVLTSYSLDQTEESSDTATEAFLPFARPLGLMSTGIANEKALAGIIVFNAALSLHLTGLRASDTGLLVDASVLYNIAFSFFSSLRFDEEAVMLGLLASANNLGNIDTHLGKAHDDIIQCQRLLASCLSTAECCCTKEEENIFAFNAFCFDPKKTIPSAPAA